MILPKKFDYFLPINEEPHDLENQGINDENDDKCPICMLNLSVEMTPIEKNKTPMLRMTNYKEKIKQIMNTPCGHKFHVNCLLEWMKMKMICPTCRSVLPEL